MPLQVASKALGLSAPVVRAQKASWLFAETLNLIDMTCLLAYRSIRVREASAMYQGIMDLLDRSIPELIYQGKVEDSQMMGGAGEWLVYLLRLPGSPVAPADPRAAMIVDMVRGWGSALHPLLVAQEVAKRLEQVGTVI